jgi:hypothetical protein
LCIGDGLENVKEKRRWCAGLVDESKQVQTAVNKAVSDYEHYVKK